ncbi:calcium/sodium antiporter [Luteimonas sp. RD2P54]|uniref:Calcium/sodium antiporter n=1 Tax=Luteimonas endophytica TaxID=3042023 RepID=A0ABT6JDJ3_9GAMM|nr:calcium/sodium antiporter [Luteimonas endophytica]MDH5824898.1 calcium/sodium antiporter [Luteimonas endophytica]
MTLLLFLGGLAALLGGAEMLVRGASRLAAATGLSPLVIGLTVVALGTSAPELAVGIGAARSGVADLAVGNVVGSNITNVLLILGLSAVIAPLTVSRQLIRLDVPVMIVCSVAVMLLTLDGRLSRIEGAALFAASLGYLGLLLWLALRGDDAEDDQAERAKVPRGPASRAIDLALVAAGLALLVAGADWLVEAATGVAAAMGVSELVIGLTVVAVGTSLPEIATSLLAMLRGEREMAVGNVVGSNVLNLLLVLALTAAISAQGLAVGDAVIRFDLPVMTAVALACLPIFYTGHCIRRWEGAVFLGYYGAYLAYLLLDAAGHDALPAYSAVMMRFVVPLTALTLGMLVLRSLHYRRARARELQGDGR